MKVSLFADWERAFSWFLMCVSFVTSVLSLLERETLQMCEQSDQYHQTASALFLLAQFSSASRSSLNVGNAPETWNVLGLSIKRPHQQLRTERERVCVSLLSSGLAVLWCAPLHIRNFQDDKAERYSSSLGDFSFGALIHISFLWHIRDVSLLPKVFVNHTLYMQEAP